MKSHENVKSSSAKKFRDPLNSTCDEIDMQDDFIPSFCFSTTNFDDNNNNGSDSDDVFFQPQEIGNAEDIVPIIPIKECSESQHLNYDKRDYFRQYWERKQKFINLEAIASNLASPQKNIVVRHRTTEVDSTKEYQSLVCDKVINYLKSMWEKRLIPYLS